MSAMQRTKGQSGEREIAGIVRDLTGFAVRRRVRQHDGDSDLEGLPGWAVEVKRHRTATRGDIAAWWRQSVAQAGGLVPVLFYRLDRAEWRSLWPLATLLVEQRADYWTSFAWTAETSVEAWAAVANAIRAHDAGRDREPWTDEILTVPRGRARGTEVVTATTACAAFPAGARAREET